MANRGGKMKEWKDIKIPASLFEEIKELIKANENYNSVSDFARIASMKELERIGREVL